MDRSTLIGLGLLLATASSDAFAQEYNAQTFSPAAGPNAAYSVEYGRTLPHLEFTGGVLLNYSSRSVVEVFANGDEEPVVDQQLAAHVLAAVGITEWAELGINIPVYFVNDVTWNGETRDGIGLGDISLRPKVSFLNAEDSLVGLALVVDLTLPTGAADRFVGAGSVTATPRLAFDVKIADWQFAANAGALVQSSRSVRDVDLGTQLVWGASAEYSVLEGIVLVGGELTGRTDFNDAFGQDVTPVEGLAGAKLVTNPGVVVTAAAGAGIASGIGSPEFRALLGIGYAPRDLDFDKDGIQNSADECPRDAEDVDGYQDADGCPEPDNDLDGIADAADQCPMEAEDTDNFKDEDGCPDLDNDADGVADTDDQCPDKAEDMDGFQDSDGCPDEDNDNDGVLDANDKCPSDAEDLDEFQDTDGCPEADNDNDGILDADDQCPNEAGLVEDNGCPPKETKAVREAGQIKILDVVYFETGKATIKAESNDLLNQVALVLRSNPDITKVEVGGHTDDVGNDAKNLKLSQERADSVKAYLVSKGIDAGRLDAVGYGELQPLIPGRSKAARAQNRRVEFKILSEGQTE
ncbi:MAG: OmpA family protein [bacterium]